MWARRGHLENVHRVWPWESCACGWSPASRGRTEGRECWIATPMSALLCSARVQPLWPAAFWLAPPAFLPFFLLFPQLNWRRGGCSSFLSLQLSCLADAVPWTQMSASIWILRGTSYACGKSVEREDAVIPRWAVNCCRPVQE